MDDKIALLDRLKQVKKILKNKGLATTQVELAKAIDCSPAYLNDALHDRNRRLSVGFLEKIADAFPDVLNKEYLLTGKGEVEKIDKRKLRPHIPPEIVSVAAGFVGTSIGSVSDDDCDMLPVIPYLPNYDFVINVNGDSMEPVLLNNDKIACKWIEPSEDIRLDKIYVVDSNEGPVVKMIKPQGEDIVCHSLNPRYEDYTINKNDVLRLARVVGVVREL